MKELSNKDPINLAFICDNNFALATRVALQSIFQNRDPHATYMISVVSDDLSVENQTMLAELSSKQFEIEIVGGGAY